VTEKEEQKSYRNEKKKRRKKAKRKKLKRQNSEGVRFELAPPEKEKPE